MADAAVSDLLWDAALRERLLRQGLSSQEIVQVVEVAEAVAGELVRARRVVDAARVLLPELLLSIDPPLPVPAVYRSPAQALRDRAAELEQRDAKVGRLRRALEEYEDFDPEADA